MWISIGEKSQLEESTCVCSWDPTTIIVPEPWSASQLHLTLSGVKLKSSLFPRMLMETIFAADTKNMILNSNLHQHCSAGSPGKGAAISYGISN